MTASSTLSTTERQDLRALTRLERARARAAADLGTYWRNEAIDSIVSQRSGRHHDRRLPLAQRYRVLLEVA